MVEFLGHVGPVAGVVLSRLSRRYDDSVGRGYADVEIIFDCPLALRACEELYHRLLDSSQFLLQ